MHMVTSANSSSVTADADEAISLAVVEAVSVAADTPVLELPPLYDAIDPDVLDELFAGRQAAERITFRYAGHLVTVHGDRTIEILDVDEAQTCRST